MNKRQILDYLEKIESGHSVEIRKITNEEYQLVRSQFPTATENDSYRIMKDIYPIVEDKLFSKEVIKSTSFVSISGPGFKKFSGLDKKPKQNNEKSSTFVIGLFLAFLDKFPVEINKFTVDYNTYDTKKVNGYTGFYFREKLMWVEKDGKQYNNV